MYQTSLVSPPKRDGINHADDTINYHVLLRPPSAAAWPAKARVGQYNIHRKQARGRNLGGLSGSQHRPQPIGTTTHTMHADRRARPCRELHTASHEALWLRQRGPRMISTPCKRGCVFIGICGRKRTVRSSAVVHAMRMAALREGARLIADLGQTLMG